MDIPKDKNYPKDSVQCDKCGGYGCKVCSDKGWLSPKDHANGRRCSNPACNKPLHPTCFPVYCSNKCARDDAQRK